MMDKDIFSDFGNYLVGIAYDQSIIPYPEDVIT
jgi:hypothetical protein